MPLRQKAFGLGGKETLQPQIQFILVGKGLVLQGAAHGQEQMIVRGHKVWAVLWVDGHFPAQLKQLLAGYVCNVWSCIVKEEGDTPVFTVLR